MTFLCNICGQQNTVEALDQEASSCTGCGSNVRLRALIYLLSKELFGDGFPLPAFPRLSGVKGLGLSDQLSYASRLSGKFDYTNTFYDRQPRLDMRKNQPKWLMSISDGRAGIRNYCVGLATTHDSRHVFQPPSRSPPRAPAPGVQLRRDPAQRAAPRTQVPDSRRAPPAPAGRAPGARRPGRAGTHTRYCPRAGRSTSCGSSHRASVRRLPPAPTATPPS